MLIYNDTIRFEFDEPTHKYTVSKKVEDVWLTPEPVAGVTTICGIIQKEALIGWSAKEAAYYLRDNLKDLKDLKVLAEEAKTAFRRKSDAGKRAGTIGHALVEALLQDKEVILPTDPELKKQAESVRKAFELWRQDFAPEVISQEVPFYSMEFNFAGKFDLLCKIGGKLTVVDFKTTNPSYYNPDGLYAEYFSQLGGYALGVEEMLGKNIEQLMVVNLPKTGEEYKVKTLEDLGLTKLDAKLYFLNCLNLYKSNMLFNWRIK